MTDIFLSYSSKDLEKVRPVHDALTSLRLALFWDQHVPVGENWDQWIRRHLAGAKVVVVFWTRSSAASLNVQHEAAIGREDGKLVPVMLEAMKAIDFPMGFYTMQAALLADWGGSTTHAGYRRLVEAIQTRCKSDGATLRRLSQSEDAADVAELIRLSVTGDAGAQTHLGFRFRQGAGVPKNDVEAARLFRLAAVQGNPNAQYSLCQMHSSGQGGVQQSDGEAVRLCRLAADQGHERALGQLGYWHELGLKGLGKDDAEAVRLYSLAAAAGNQWADKQLRLRGLRP